MTTDHYDPHGQALLDYFNGDTSAKRSAARETGDSHRLPPVSRA
jgi:hypothetical protein